MQPAQQPPPAYQHGNPQQQTTIVQQQPLVSSSYKIIKSKKKTIKKTRIYSASVTQWRSGLTNKIQYFPARLSDYAWTMRPTRYSFYIAPCNGLHSWGQWLVRKALASHQQGDPGSTPGQGHITWVNFCSGSLLCNKGFPCCWLPKAPLHACFLNTL